MSIIYLIMFIILICIIIYIIYDYINYKNNVDETIQITTDYINSNLKKVIDNSKELDTKLKNKIVDLNTSMDNLKLDNETNSLLIDEKISNTDYKLELLESNDKINNKLIENNNNILLNKINDRISSLNTINSNENINQNYISTKLTDIDNYIELNKRIFNYRTSSTNESLNILKNVNALGGMTIKTDLSTDKNFRICGNTDNCIKMSVNQDKFNIIPEKINNLYINSYDNKPIANFDMKNNSIFLGGTDVKSPFYIIDSNVFLENINFVSKNRINSNNIENSVITSIYGDDIDLMYSNIQNSALYIEKIINESAPYITNLANNISTFTNSIFVNYTIYTELRDKRPISSINIKIIPNINLYPNTTITFKMTEIDKFVDTNNVLITNEYLYNIATYNINVMEITIAKKVNANTEIYFKIENYNLITYNIKNKDKLLNYSTIGIINNNSMPL